MTCGPIGCPGQLGIDGDGNFSNIWYCDGLACDRGGIHTTCKKAREADGYDFQYTERARLAQAVYEKERDIRLVNTPMPMVMTRSVGNSRVQKAIQAAAERLEKDEYFKK